MRIGILSDSHDHECSLDRAIVLLREQGVECLLHAGDFCAPFILKTLDSVGLPVHGVFGNVDGDRFLMGRMVARDLERVSIHGELAELELDGVRVGMCHYPQIAVHLAAGGAFDLVVYGHTHRPDVHSVGTTVVVNPGEVLGRLGRPSVAVYDTRSRGAELMAYEIDPRG